MCGRFTFYHTWAEIHALYRLTLDVRGRNNEARYNICPTQTVDFVTLGDDGGHELKSGRWWLVPWWAKEMPKQIMINARIETVEKSGAYKDAWKTKRCLIPADGFYEWTVSADDGGKDPWFIHLPGEQPFSFAGLWAHNDKLDVTSCTIMTMEARDPITAVHDRQPVILDPLDYDEWLDPDAPGEDLKSLLLDRNIDRQLEMYRVGREVNSNRAQGPGLNKPIPPA